LPSTSMVVWSSALPLDWQHARRNGMSDAGCQPLGVLVGNRNEQRLRSKRFDEVTLDSVRRGNVGLLQYREMHEAHRRDSRTSSSCRPPFVGVRRPNARRCRVRLATLSVLCKRFVRCGLYGFDASTRAYCTLRHRVDCGLEAQAC
jgi:hypothetical protein